MATDALLSNESCEGKVVARTETCIHHKDIQKSKNLLAKFGFEGSNFQTLVADMPV